MEKDMWGMSMFRQLALMFTLILAAPVEARDIVITFGGDVNFARSRQNPLPDRVVKNGTHRLDSLTEVLQEEWRSGDINFVNVETAVAERNGSIQGKTFVFRSHPKQFDHLLKLGVNAFALANNHAFDHGRSGMRATLAYFKSRDRTNRPLLFSGIGTGGAAFAPKIIRVKGVRVAMSSISFGSGSFSPSQDQVGMAYLFTRGHYDAVLKGLKQAKADIKILSVHYGTENVIELNGGQAKLFRRAVEEAGVHLVLGHHPHVVRGVEVDQKRNAAIFYSLGNFLFIGGAAKDGSSLGRDYGLMGKAHFTMVNGKPHLKALEAVPFKGVHLKPRRPPTARAAATINHLNGLSRRSVGARAATFSVVNPTAPRGLACFGGPYDSKLKKKCCRIEDSLYCDLPDLM